MARIKLKAGEIEVEFEGDKGEVIEKKAEEFMGRLLDFAYPNNDVGRTSEPIPEVEEQKSRWFSSKKI